MRANGNAPSRWAASRAVGTLPEYRRQGLLRAITTRSFADMREPRPGGRRAVGIAGGDLPALRICARRAPVTYRIDTVDVGIRDGNGGTARVARVDADDGFDVLKKLYIEFVEQRTGYLHRASALWMNNALSSRPRPGPAHIAVAYAANAATGYVDLPRRKDKTGHPTRSQELTIKDFVWLNADAYRSLWSWLARHDLVGRIVWIRAPIDDPAPELFVEPRLLNAQSRDGTGCASSMRPSHSRNAAIRRAMRSRVEWRRTNWRRGMPVAYKLECAPDGGDGGADARESGHDIVGQGARESVQRLSVCATTRAVGHARRRRCGARPRDADIRDASCAALSGQFLMAIHRELYYRHRLPVRIMHWINVIAFVVMLMSGLMIFNAHPTLYWGKQSYGDAAGSAQRGGVSRHGRRPARHHDDVRPLVRYHRGYSAWRRTRRASPST